MSPERMTHAPWLGKTWVPDSGELFPSLQITEKGSELSCKRVAEGEEGGEAERQQIQTMLWLKDLETHWMYALDEKGPE